MTSTTQQPQGHSVALDDKVAKRMLDSAVEMLGSGSEREAAISILRTLSISQGSSAQPASEQLITALYGYNPNPEAETVSQRLMRELDPKMPEKADQAFFWARVSTRWAESIVGSGRESEASSAVQRAQRIFERNGDFQCVGRTMILEAAITFSEGGDPKDALRKLENGRRLVSTYTPTITPDYASRITTSPVLAGIGGGAQN